MINGGTRPSILVVEDENVVAMDLVSTLEKLHYPLAGVAASGEEAVALAQARSPGLVLMDIHLRGEMDGVVAAEHIQSRLFIPVVYITAYSDEATLDRARLTHPFGYVLKPFVDREIEVAIQLALFHHKLERALRDSEQRLDAILSSIGEAVIATNPDKRITFMNRVAEKMLGWKSERAKGRLLSDVLQGTRADDLLWFRLDGKVFPLELVESTVLDSSGKPSGYVIIARDVSERLRAQEAHDRELVERAARAAAEKDHERARLKSEISLIVADITQFSQMTPVLERVADVIVKSLASWTVLHIADQDVRPIAKHADPGKAAALDELVRRWLTEATGTPDMQAVLQTGEPQLIRSIAPDELAPRAIDPEHLELLRSAGMDSLLCVPLRARQRVIGALTLVSAKATRHYDESDVIFGLQLADRIAMAIDNARLYREAQDAKTALERLYEAEQRARTEAEALFRIADAMSEAQLDLDALIKRLTDEATGMVGAKFGAFFYKVDSEQGETYLLHTLSGAPIESVQELAQPRNTPLFAPAFAGAGVVRLDDVRRDPRYGQLNPHHGMPESHLPLTSYLAVPVVSRTGLVSGGLFFGHPEAAQFTAQHERMARALAAHAAVAIDNARLFGATREAEERQSRLVADLERAVRFSEMFVGILGHDLRNPLSGITTAASLLLKRSDSDRSAKPLGRILSSAGRMSRMIDQILDFTHVRLGRGIPLERKTTDVGEVCRLVLDELRNDVDGGAHLKLEIRGDATGIWDEDRLAQLASNLVSNAVQHRQRGTPVLLTVDGSRPDAVTIEITNDGVIPAELVPVIFEPLRSGKQGRRKGSSGLGLGLYISQQIAVAHGGSIRVETDIDAGKTRFTVALPRTPRGDADQVFGSSGGKKEVA